MLISEAPSRTGPVGDCHAMARLRERLAKLFAPWRDKTTCPVCGLPIQIMNPNRYVSPRSGAWSVPISRRELVGYCMQQNGTAHDRDA